MQLEIVYFKQYTTFKQFYIYKQIKIQVKNVYETDCISVYGISADLSLDFVKVFFSNKNKSGGKNVTHVVRNKNQTDLVYVFFADCKGYAVVYHIM